MRTTGLARTLRVGAGVLGALALVSGLLAAIAGAAAAALWLLLVGAVLLLTALYEKSRYESLGGSGSGRAGAGASEERLQRTEELFRDPTTGELTRVWYDPATGERRYLPER